MVVENSDFRWLLIGDLIVNPMAKKTPKAGSERRLPISRLIGRVRHPDWLYSYLKGFYADDTRPLVRTIRYLPT